MATRKTKGKSKAKAPPFAMMPKAMIQSHGYRSLSFVARGVLVELLAQYNGDKQRRFVGHPHHGGRVGHWRARHVAEGT
ncbi:hypothetical protein [Pseudomonas aeruginosa]|uniref:hypothetical protein n=1 Tax=Pseudomonas aeruginosa TaxID=287 RepID=UPI000B14500B|nr:hypothetical protein [Pseudomonas aeruginosa]